MSDSADPGRATPAKELMGAVIVDERGPRLGCVAGVFVDEDERPLYVAVDLAAGDGEARLVPIEFVLRAPGGALVTRLGVDRIAGAPRIAPDADLGIDDLSAAHEHFGLASYEDLMAARQAAPAPTPEIARAELASEVRSGLDPLEPTIRRLRP